ncbi:MAG: molecular chaperone DjlA [Candidatus Marinimicrobia bacterium]|nr:molecular chaperone DjlA [Candidatus Neomarinimicrobiota bacterium]
MAIGKKLLWGGIGWITGGPIGAIIGYTLASIHSDNHHTNWRDQSYQKQYPQTKPGDFIVSLLVLFAKVIKADNKVLKSEINFVKSFLRKQFSIEESQNFMILLKDILDQDYALKDVCKQIQRSMDHPSRIELIHILFSLSASDNDVHPNEVKVINIIANYLNVNQMDFESIKAMFIGDIDKAYTILEIKSTATDNEIKKAYRKMATKYHPDKVSHLGKDLSQMAENKFKAVNDAYQTIKKERGLK